MSGPEQDPVAELARAQRRVRGRGFALVALGVAALLAVVALLLTRLPRPRSLRPIERPFLWRVDVAGARPSYLFGTVHVGYGVPDLPAAVLRAQDEADVTVVESDTFPSAEDGPADVAPYHRGADRLSPVMWQRLARYTRVSVEVLETWPASHLVGAVTAAMLPKAGPMDRELQARALLRGQRVAFLDDRWLEAVLGGVPHRDDRVDAVVAPTAAAAEGARADERVVAAAVRDRDNEQIAALTLILDHRAAARNVLIRLVEAYAVGCDDCCPEPTGPMSGLVPTLDGDWIDGVEAAVRAGGAFVAMGCSHLAGADSIVARLRARGHAVTRVDATP